ncbi:DUF3073 domain-containing protein [Herbiconiux sp. VKM Ac-1786]|jgi:hypothetical protein|uniref:DUF3073 domain-containing protein n=1 Tax=Herbiconiux sp. VKM Ac-1786 TaxID=2783824 RepID=UPI00188BD2CA|nr:DUF3073 domain-containing protein [Herbiconiux sp. VKM Ac-1786]MBF4572674.1 DUF3073 domain-containing protein [Herbiconiux sp. VKM Ac-1786]
MGRGRQKAKHTKVARELKYFSPDTNYSALERELTGKAGEPDYSKWIEEDDDSDDAFEPTAFEPTAPDEQKRA